MAFFALSAFAIWQLVRAIDQQRVGIIAVDVTRAQSPAAFWALVAVWLAVCAGSLWAGLKWFGF